MKNATIGKNLLRLSFTYDPCVVDFARTLTGRRWNPAEKVWTCDLLKANVESCIANGFVLSAELKSWLQTAGRPPVPIKPLDVPGLKGKLFPFQGRGVAMIEKLNGRMLLADEMGLGKTIQALAWLQLRKDSTPAVVVCPASVKISWARECSKWTDLRPFVMDSQMNLLPRPNETDVYIVNYDILGKYEEYFSALGIKTIILDEAHKIKNKTTKRAKAVAKIAKSCPHVIMLTGTPVVNRPSEMWFPIRLIDENLFPNWFKFGERYCAAKHNGYGWDFSGHSNMDELHEKLTNTIMLRRTKAEVMPELPAKIHTIVPLEADLTEYKSAEENMIAWLRENAPEKIDGVLRSEALAKVELLRQIALKVKFEQACEWIDDWLDTDGKLVVFATHRVTIKLLMEKYRNVAVKLEGADSLEDRQKAVDTFQTVPACRLFVGNIKAAGVGLTLTAANNVAFIELPWSPSDLDQAADRVHRIGQTADSVGIHYLLGVGTIDENIFGLLNAKRKVINKIVDGGDATGEGNMLADLLKQLRTKEWGK